MDFTNIFVILLSSILVNNFVMSRFLGCCPFLGVSKKINTALGMGAAVTFVMSLARSTKSIMYQNIGIAFSVSLIMMILAAVGVIPALVGAFLHNIGAFVILINSSRILRDSGGEG